MTENGGSAPKPYLAIVEDDAFVRTALQRLCHAAGLQATVYASGNEFIAALDHGAQTPDCILLDAQMTEMTGLELYRHLRERGEEFPTVVITAHDGPDVRARYLAAGVGAYLQKPVGESELLEAIGHVLRPTLTSVPSQRQDRRTERC